MHALLFDRLFTEFDISGMIIRKHNLRTKIAKKKEDFVVDAVQSTCAITYDRETDMIINHISPDKPWNKGITCPVNRNTRFKKDRTSTRTSQYQIYEEKEVKPDIIERQEAVRQRWLSQPETWN